MAENWPVLLMVRSLGHGGTERQVAELAKALDRTRFTPHVACFDPGGFRSTELNEQGIPILQMDMHSFASADTSRAFSKLRTYVRHHGIRLIHTFDHPMVVFGVPAARLIGVPVLSSQRSHRSLIPPKYLPMIRLSDRLAKGIVVNCEAVRDHLIADYHIRASKIHVCYNALDTDRFRPGSRIRPPELASARLVIGVACVLRAIKGLSTLVDAFSQLAREQSGLQLLIVGSGPEREPLEQQARSLGLNNVNFHDAAADVTPWLRATDIFVLPSLSEAFSNSLMEAMASGCCVIASNTGGNPELVRHNSTGLLFEKGDASSLAAQLRTLINDESLRNRLAAAGSEFVRSNFSADRSAARLGEIYASCLA